MNKDYNEIVDMYAFQLHEAQFCGGSNLINDIFIDIYKRFDGIFHYPKNYQDVCKYRAFTFLHDQIDIEISFQSWSVGITIIVNNKNHWTVYY